MGGLVAYASSDDEGEDETAREVNVQKLSTLAKLTEGGGNEKKTEVATAPISASDRLARPSKEKEKEQTTVIGSIAHNAVPLGPSLPPIDASITNDTDTAQVPSSPYSANRALIHDLTLPTVPNLDIPPSPPGSPPPGANKKLEQFLELKRKGTHFNSKLEQSAALKNPSLMDKLMAFVDLDEASQYETTLSTDLWDPKAFPDWASRDRLRKSRERIAKEKEVEKGNTTRSAVEFTSSTMASTGASTARVGGLIGRGEKRKGGWK